MASNQNLWSPIRDIARTSPSPPRMARAVKGEREDVEESGKKGRKVTISGKITPTALESPFAFR